MVLTIFTSRYFISFLYLKKAHNMSKNKKITKEIAKKVGGDLGVDWDKYDFNQFLKGINVELEHGTVGGKWNITDDDYEDSAKIALAHLDEIPDYYSRLGDMESEEKDDENIVSESFRVKSVVEFLRK